jgi:hypothetical protein
LKSPKRTPCVFSLEHVHESGDDVVVNDSLQLLLAAGSDVGERPARFLADALAVIGQELVQARQHRAVDHKLCLLVVARDDVTHRSQRRGLDLGRLVHQELHQTAANARVDDSLDLLVGAVREVRECPASVGENFLVV